MALKKVYKCYSIITVNKNTTPDFQTIALNSEAQV